MDFLEYDDLLQQFLEKVTHGSVRRWQVQRYISGDDSISYVPPYCSKCRRYKLCPHTPELTADDLRQHFKQIPWKPKNHNFSTGIFASHCVPAIFENSICKFLCIDVDSTYAVEIIWEKLVPVLEDYGIEFIWEHSFEDTNTGRINKGKLWFFVDCTHTGLSDFVTLLLKKAGLEDWQHLKRDTRKLSESQQFKIEFYPYQKVNSMIRLMGGYHLRNKKVNPITFRGKCSSKPTFIMRSVIACKELTWERMGEISLELITEFHQTSASDLRKQKRAVERATQATSRGFFLHLAHYYCRENCLRCHLLLNQWEEIAKLYTKYYMMWLMVCLMSPVMTSISSEYNWIIWRFLTIALLLEHISKVQEKHGQTLYLSRRASSSVTRVAIIGGLINHN